MKVTPRNQLVLKTGKATIRTTGNLQTVKLNSHLYTNQLGILD